MQTVILFNFFSASPFAGKWNLLYRYLADIGHLSATDPRLTGQAAGHRPPPEFDALAHRELCHELKQLYVAVTRARQELAFVEEDEAAVQPVLAMWTSVQKPDQARGAQSEPPGAAAKSVRPSVPLVHVRRQLSDDVSIIMIAAAMSCPFLTLALAGGIKSCTYSASRGCSSASRGCSSAHPWLLPGSLCMLCACLPACLPAGPAPPATAAQRGRDALTRGGPLQQQAVPHGA